MKKACILVLVLCACLVLMTGIALGADSAAENAELYQISKGDKVGFIDVQGNVVIEPVWDEAFFDSENNGLIPVREGKLWGLVNRNGEVVAAPAYAEEPAILYGEVEFIPVKVGKKYGFINRSGEMVIQPKWNGVEPFQNGLARVNAGSEKKPQYGYIDQTGAEIIKPQYADALDFCEGLAAVKVKKLYGYIDAQGTLVVEPQFQNAQAHAQGLAAVMVDGKYGYIDTAGKMVIEPRFEEVDQWYREVEHMDVKVDGKWGVINLVGEYLVQPEWEEISSYGALWCVKKAEKYGAVDHNGKEMIPAVYDEVLPIWDKAAEKDYYWVKQGEAWGVFSEAGELLCEPQWTKEYNTTPYFSNPCEDFIKGSDQYIVDVSGKGTLIGAYGLVAVGTKTVMVKKEFLSPKSQLLTFDGKLICEADCPLPWYTDYGLYIISGDEGRQGLMNEEGNIVSSSQWSKLSMFWEKGGVVEVEQGSYRGYMNTEGKVIYWSDESGQEVPYVDYFQGAQGSVAEDAPYFLQGVHWGMTAEELVQAAPHSGKPLNISGLAMYSDVKVGNLPISLITYSFDEKRGDTLTSIVLGLDETTNTPYDDFSILRDMLIAQYGFPMEKSGTWTKSSYEEKYKDDMNEAIRKGYYSERISLGVNGSIMGFLSIKGAKGEPSISCFLTYMNDGEPRDYYESLINPAAAQPEEAQAPASGESTAFSIRNGVTFGMSQEEVIQIEGREPDIRDETGLIFDNQTAGGLKASIFYSTEKNQVQAIMYVVEEKHTQNDGYIEDYESLKASLSEKYGKPTFETLDWDGDATKYDPQDYGDALVAGDVRYLAQWKGSNVQINLFLDNDDGNIEIILAYMPPKGETPAVMDEL